MPRVNLFLIGVNKAGSSWLYQLLGRHPDVFMAEAKELYFFGTEGRPEERPSSLEDYHRHFPFQEPFRYFGDATVMYYREPAVAKEIQDYNPEAKILAIVRDPIDRLRSQFQYQKQLGLLDEDVTLAEVIDTDGRRLLRDSHYEETLPAFEERFGPDQCHIVSLEQGQQDPAVVWHELLSFLELDPVPFPSSDSAPENPTGSPAFRWVYRHTVRPLRRIAPGVYRRLLENSLARGTKQALLTLLGTAESMSIAPPLRARLEKEFAPTYAYLRRQGFDVYETERQPPGL